MDDRPVNKVLEDFFSKSGKRDWEKIAVTETDKKNPLEYLSWRGKDEILFLPYYDPQDTADLQHLQRLHAASDGDRFSGRPWANLPAITVDDDHAANTMALNHLSSGVDGIFFYLPRTPDFSRLLFDIQWPYCALAFRFDTGDAPLGPLAFFVKEHFDPESIRGAFFWDTVPKNVNWPFFIQSCKNLKALGLFVPSASPSEEISEALLKGVQTFERFAEEGSSEIVFRSIAFSLAADVSLLESAARLKALRMLWLQVAHAYGYNDYKLEDLHIHIRSEQVADAHYAPHENMLKATFAAIAAVTGGCDSLTIHSDHQSPAVIRQARNISNILLEEAFLGAVTDPFAGAWAIDSITNAIADKAWTMFQQKCGSL